MPYFGGGYWGGGSGGPIDPGVPSGDDTSLDVPTTLYCTDEDVAIYLAEDYATLAPRASYLAAGTDGVFSSSARWTLTSATTYLANVPARGVVVLGPEPKEHFGKVATGTLFAANSSSSGAVILRRLGQRLGVGQPPSPAAGLTGVRFAVPTYQSQIAEATKMANTRYGIDPSVAGRKPTDISPRSLDDLRQWCVLTVAQWGYTMASKSQDSDYRLKLGLVSSRLKEVEARLQILWGPLGDSSAPSGPFNAKIMR